MDPIYQSHLEWISSQRLKASRIFVEDDGPFRAAVILCEAARAERRALMSLAAPSAETRLRSAIEHCGLLVEARAAEAVFHDAWPAVVERAQDVEASKRAAYLARIQPAVEAMLQRAQRLAREHPLLSRVPEIASEGTDGAARKALISLTDYVREFPGDAAAWLGIGMLRRRVGDLTGALDAVRRAGGLAPNEDAVRGFELAVAVDVLPPAEFRSLLAEPMRRLLAGDGGADMAFAVAGSLLWLQQRGGGDERELVLAEQVCRVGLQRPDARGRIRALLKAAIFIIEDVRAGRTPDSVAFLNAGLPDLIPSARQHGALHVLRQSQQRYSSNVAAAS